MVSDMASTTHFVIDKTWPQGWTLRSWSDRWPGEPRDGCETWHQGGRHIEMRHDVSGERFELTPDQCERFVNEDPDNRGVLATEFVRQHLTARPIRSGQAGWSPEKLAEYERCRAESGHVDDDRPLVAFLVRLAQSELPVGAVEDVAIQALRISIENPAQYENGWLAAWAQDLAGRLSPLDAASHDVNEAIKQSNWPDLPDLSPTAGPDRSPLSTVADFLVQWGDVEIEPVSNGETVAFAVTFTPYTEGAS